MLIFDMSAAQSIYQSLIAAPKLEPAVQQLRDIELRTLRGALARGEITGWPADLVQGVCMVVGCERFMNPEHFQDQGHGSEVTQ